MTKTQKWLLISLLLLATLSAATVLGVRYWFSSHQGPKAALANTLIPIDFSEPDALIQSQSLVQLPRDLLKVPLLKATLTEEFAFYYEEQEARLSLAGTLRRLAYEHDLNIGDQLIQLRIMEDFPPLADIRLWLLQAGLLQRRAVPVIDPGLCRWREVRAELHAAVQAKRADQHDQGIAQ